MTSAQNPDEVRLTVPLPPDAEHGAENMWAEPVSGDTYRVRNIPTWAYELSLDDVVEAHGGEDGILIFGDVVERGGHSTYRIIPAAETDETTFERYWAPLQDAGCRYESHATQPLYAVDVPPRADVRAVYEMLDRGERDGIWEFEEGHCGHALS
jgi:hypothetical protein